VIRALADGFNLADPDRVVFPPNVRCDWIQIV
jgi:hypothetical protein